MTKRTRVTFAGGPLDGGSRAFAEDPPEEFISEQPHYDEEAEDVYLLEHVYKLVEGVYVYEEEPTDG